MLQAELEEQVKLAEQAEQVKLEQLVELVVQAV